MIRPSDPPSSCRTLRPASGRAEAAALNGLLDDLYEDLRLEARRQLCPGRPHTLQPTALLNEALVRLLSREGRPELGPGRLCSYLARVMRSVLVDHARAKQAAKRGGGGRAVPLEALEECLEHESRIEDVLAVHDALERLGRDQPELAELAELRFFGQLSVPEVAAARDVPVSRVKAASHLLRQLLRASS